MNSFAGMLWFGVAWGLLWLPVAALLASSLLSVTRASWRQKTAVIWWASISATLGGFWTILPAFNEIVAPSNPDWTLLFHHLLGVWPAALVQLTLGIITGAYLGHLFARVITKATQTSVYLGVSLQLILSVVVLFICYMPPAGCQDFLGGGSGYGEGVPRIFMSLFKNVYFPIFRQMQTVGLTLYIPSEYAPVVLWVCGLSIMIALCARRMGKIYRRRIS